MHASQAKSSLSKSSQVKSSMRREVRICLAISKPGTTVSRSPLVSPGLPWSSARSLSPLTVVTRGLVRIWVLSQFHIWVLSQFHIWVLSQFHIWVLSQVPLPKMTAVFRLAASGERQKAAECTTSSRRRQSARRPR